MKAGQNTGQHHHQDTDPDWGQTQREINDQNNDHNVDKVNIDTDDVEVLRSQLRQQLAYNEKLNAELTQSKREQKLLQTLVDTIPALTGYIDGNGRVLCCNQFFEQTFQLPSAEIINRSIDQIWPDLQPLLQKLLGEEVVGGDFQLADQQGIISNYHVKFIKCSPDSKADVSPNDREIGFLVWGYCTKERDDLKEALNVALRQSEQLERLKNNFLANISHEVRTPLSGIIGYTEILRDTLENEEDKIIGDKILRLADRLLQTLLVLIDLARLHSDSLELDLSELIINEEIAKAKRFFLPAALQKGISLSDDLPQQKIVSLLDRRYFRQIINSLISNAIKFTSEGGVQIRVSTKGESNSSVVQIQVSDSGIGISEEFLPQLFDEFKQESSGLNRKFEGVGLSLTLAKKLVILMNGTLDVQSRRGYGSIFTLSFPVLHIDKHIPIQTSRILSDPGILSNTIQRQNEKASLTVQHHQDSDTELCFSNSETTFPSIENDFSSGSVVLLVEDSLDLLQLGQVYLKNICQRIDITISGEQAVVMSRRQKYDLILLDINLGAGIDGVQTLHRIRNIKGYQQRPIVAVTAYAMPEDRKKFLQQGFNDYLAKPYKKEALIAMVKRYCD